MAPPLVSIAMPILDTARFLPAALDSLLAQDYAELAWRVEQLEAALSLIASTTPKADKLEASWLALQARARELLGG